MSFVIEHLSMALIFLLRLAFKVVSVQSVLVVSMTDFCFSLYHCMSQQVSGYHYSHHKTKQFCLHPN